MKKVWKIGLLLLIALFVFDQDAYAQRRKKKKKKSSKVEQYFDESGNFQSRLWYGGNFNLGFSGATNLNIFNLGLAPMVGYKIIEPLSVGPRVGIDYTYVKGIGTDGIAHVVQPVGFSVGAFTRFKFLRNFFLHGEFGLESEEVFYVDGPNRLVIDPTTNEVFTERENQNAAYIGGGYNSGGLLGYEILVLFNALDDTTNINSNPFSIRFGMTYKF